MVEIKEISYKDERLGFFADQRKLVQKRYDRLGKQIKPDEPYMSERRQFLDDCGRELSFYNDVVEMLENGVVTRAIVSQIFEEIFLCSYYENGKIVVNHDDIIQIKNKYQRRLNL